MQLSLLLPPFREDGTDTKRNYDSADVWAKFTLHKVTEKQRHTHFMRENLTIIDCGLNGKIERLL